MTTPNPPEKKVARTPEEASTKADLDNPVLDKLDEFVRTQFPRKEPVGSFQPSVATGYAFEFLRLRVAPFKHITTDFTWPDTLVIFVCTLLCDLNLREKSPTGREAFDSVITFLKGQKEFEDEKRLNMVKSIVTHAIYNNDPEPEELKGGYEYTTVLGAMHCARTGQGPAPVFVFGV